MTTVYTYTSRAALAAITSAVAASESVFAVYNDTMAEAWDWSATSTAAAVDGKVIVPSDAPATGRIVRSASDYLALVRMANVVSQSSIGNALAAGRILVGGADGKAKAVVLGGDGTIDQNGNLTVTGTDGVAFGPLATASAVNVTMTAGGVLSGHFCVCADSAGHAVYPSIDTLSDGQALIGITTGASASGAAATVTTSGPIIYSAWSWTPGPVYCGDAGAPVQTPPAGAWVRQIGTAISATTIIINIEPIISTE